MLGYPSLRGSHFFRQVSLWLWLCGLNMATGYAQEMLHGQVVSEQGEPLIGATVQWFNGEGAITDAEGHFQLARAEVSTILVVSYVGYQSQTIQAPDGQTHLTVTLVEGANLSTVEVRSRRRDNYTSTLQGRNVESITSQELRKAPCCSLGESFETNASVDANYTDPLTGVREISMLGLRGIYTQLLFEKRPTMTGLATPYGLDLLPGPWVESIQLSKGSASVQPGASSITGQINTEFIKPMLGPRLFVNLFGSTMGRGEANVFANHRFNEKWSSGVLVHGSFIDNHHDFDRDGFKDMPNRQTGVGLYRLFYQSGQWEGQFNVLLAHDRRQAGQHSIHDHGQPVFDELYLLNQATDNLEVFGKVGFMGFNQPYQSMGLIYGGAWRSLDNQYGRTLHTGQQRTAYANWLYSTIIGTSDHQLILGATGQYDDIQENLNDINLDRRETTAGVYGEYTYLYNRPSGQTGGLAGFTAIAALRLDHHNLGGFQAVPRLNLKFNLSASNALRLSASRGWRSPNVLVENLGWLASSRAMVFEQTPRLETAWNMGVNFTQDFRIGQRDASLVLDAYRTSFQNQIVVDMETDAQQLYFYNLDGRSFSHSLMSQLTYELLRGVEVKLAYKLTDARTTYRGELRELPLVARHRLLATLDYVTPNERWRLNAHYQLTGRQRLPDHSILPAGVSIFQPQVAPAFGVINAQLTWKANDRWEYYAGGENLTNYRQARAIIGAEDPFGAYFDATQVFAPTFGRRFHLGLRYTLP